MLEETLINPDQCRTVLDAARKGKTFPAPPPPSDRSLLTTTQEFIFVTFTARLRREKTFPLKSEQRDSEVWTDPGYADRV